MYIYIYTHIFAPDVKFQMGTPSHTSLSSPVRPVHLLRVFLLRVLESKFPGDPLSNSTDIRIPTP